MDEPTTHIRPSTITTFPRPTTQHADEQRIFRASIHRRARYLERISRPGTHDSPAITAYIGRSLLMALVGYCGDELAADVFGWLRSRLREGAGCCQFCGEQKPQADDVMCRTCMASIEAELACDEPEDAAMKTTGHEGAVEHEAAPATDDAVDDAVAGAMDERIADAEAGAVAAPRGDTE